MTQRCPCHDWTMVGHPTWAYGPSWHDGSPYPADGEHHPDCERYEPPSPSQVREALGWLVRHVWLTWAHEQENPKPSWLVAWNDLDEDSKEVDRRIGERLAGAGFVLSGGTCPNCPKLEQAEAEAMALVMSHEVVIKRLQQNHDTMLETLTHAQQRGKDLLERARRAEAQRDELLASFVELKRG